MFKRVLIAEDQQTTNFWVQQTLKDQGLTDIQYAYYCDDALLRLKRGMQDSKPFDLLITDLSFVDDGREQKLLDGTELIESSKKQQPDLKILVFSAESSPAVVNRLFRQFAIDGYVHKGRRDAADLKDAIETIRKGKKYIPAEFQQAIRNKNAHDFTKFDLLIISQIVAGTPQKDIPAYLQQQGERASSLSSVEKRLNIIKDALGFSKNEQLVAYCLRNKIIKH